MSNIIKYGDSGAEPSKPNHFPEKKFSAEGRISGPVLLDIAGDLIDGSVKVGNFEYPSARVSTRSTLKSVIEAVQGTRIELSERTPIVHVPHFVVPPTVIQGGSGSRTVFSGGASFVQFGGGTTIISGGPGRGGENSVQVEIALPADSGVRADLGSSDLDIQGDLVGIEGDLSSGSITVHGTVRKARADLSSGSFHIDRVTEAIEATASSGSLNIPEYTGSLAKLRVSSGNANLNAGREATGIIDVRVSSGNANLGGTRGRSLQEGGNLDIRTRKSSGNINRF